MTTTTDNLEEIDVHSRRAWALTSMLMTCVDHSTQQPSKEVLSETLSSIWEHLDAIGYEMQKIQKGGAIMSTTTRKNLAETYGNPRLQRNQPRDDEAGAQTLAEMEDADPSLTPLLVRIITGYMRSKPLPK